MKLGDHPNFETIAQHIIDYVVYNKQELFSVKEALDLFKSCLKTEIGESDISELFNKNWTVVPEGTNITYINQGVALTLDETKVMIEYATEFCAEQGWGEKDHLIMYKLITHKRTLEAQQKPTKEEP